MHQEDQTFNKIGFSLLKSKFVSSSCPKRLGNENSGTFFQQEDLKVLMCHYLKKKIRIYLIILLRPKVKILNDYFSSKRPILIEADIIPQ